MAMLIARRRLFASALGSLSVLSGCDRASRAPGFRNGIDSAEWVNRWLANRIIPASALAREYPPDRISRHFRANGSTDPTDPEYLRQAAGGFADWRLRVDGLVEHPLSLSLDQLRAMPRRARSPVTTALKDGAASASGPASSCRMCSTKPGYGPPHAT